jgi:hypothetical protein
LGFGGTKLVTSFFPTVSSNFPLLFNPLIPDYGGNVIHPYAMIAAFLGSLFGAFIAPPHLSPRTGDLAAVSIGIALTWSHFWAQPGIAIKIWGAFVVSCVYGFVGFLAGSIARDTRVSGGSSD